MNGHVLVNTGEGYQTAKRGLMRKPYHPRDCN